MPTIITANTITHAAIKLTNDPISEPVIAATPTLRDLVTLQPSWALGYPPEQPLPHLLYQLGCDDRFGLVPGVDAPANLPCSCGASAADPVGPGHRCSAV